MPIMGIQIFHSFFVILHQNWIPAFFVTLYNSATLRRKISGQSYLDDSSM